MRAQALLNSLLKFSLLPMGFSNRDLRELIAPLLGREPGHMTQGMMTYDLRRLRLHGLIERIPHTNRYRTTDFGLRIALFFTKTYSAILRPGLSVVAENAHPVNAKLRKPLGDLQISMNRLCEQVKLAS